MEHERFMRRCLELAQAAMAAGDVPVGALVVDGDQILGEGLECRRALLDPAGHAEVRALQAACQSREATILPGTRLYSTVEPCVMCAYVLRSVHIGVVVYGVPAGRLGAATSTYALLTDAIPGWPPPPVVIPGVLGVECEALLEEYARAKGG